MQITVNNKAPNNDKILIIRTSYGCVVTPFLTLNCKELHAVDIRNYQYIGDCELDLSSYIKNIKPDYVIVLHHSVSSLTNDGRYDFIK